MGESRAAAVVVDSSVESARANAVQLEGGITEDESESDAVSRQDRDAVQPTAFRALGIAGVGAEWGGASIILSFERSSITLLLPAYDHVIVLRQKHA